jgi:hypothetical protein
VQKVLGELQGPVQGLMTELGGKGRTEILNMNLGVDSGFVVLQSGREPSPLAGIAGLAVGLLVGAVLVFDLVRRRGDEPPRKRDRSLSLRL